MVIMNSVNASRIAYVPSICRTFTRWEGSWVCKSCRTKKVLWSAFSSSRRTLHKPYYVTTPIFYVNAAPHVGHMYTLVLADILKRWQLLKGKTAILCTGTDEHGMKVERAASQAGKSPKEFCNITSESFRTLAKRVGILNDHFVRTTDSDHVDAVQFFWTRLEQKGFIYESKHEGWYCVSDETFYPDSAVEKRLDPFTGRTFMASKETSKEVEWTSEKNYHFRLSAFRDKLLDFYKQNTDFIVPSARMADVVKSVTMGLDDLSVSRPIERLRWGIPVPNDASQTIYVWLDALVNYITKAGYPWPPGGESTTGWPADVQVIGKDIVRFHCIYWPAFLMAVGIQPPRQVLTHAHWTLGRRKMAKSTGNVVNPFFAIDRFGVDLMRWYLAHDGGILNDSDYGNEIIVERYKKCLRGGLGNLVSRITRSTKWNVTAAVQLAAKHSHLGDLQSGAEIKQVNMLLDLPGKVNREVDGLNPGTALQTIMDAVYETNQYITTSEPWILANRQDSMSYKQLNDIIFNCSEAIRMVGIMLQPYMPLKASQMLDTIGVKKENRTWNHVQYRRDFDYGTSSVEHSMEYDVLFPRLPVED